MHPMNTPRALAEAGSTLACALAFHPGHSIFSRCFSALLRPPGHQIQPPAAAEPLPPLAPPAGTCVPMPLLTISPVFPLQVTFAEKEEYIIR